MNFPTAQVIQFGLIALTLGSYSLALLDWSQAPAEALAPGRAPGRRWTAWALALLALVAACAFLGQGPRAAWRFMMNCGLLWLVQAAGLAFLVQAGGLWARRLGADPFPPARRRWADWPWKPLAFLWLILLGWTVALARFWPRRPIIQPHDPFGLGAMPPALEALALLGITSLAPILEECLFRHYLLYRLTGWLRRAPQPFALATLLSSAAWALGHYGSIEPFGIKFAQIFGMGLLLSLAARRYGLGAAIALHWAFNLSMALMALLKYPV